VSYGGGTTKPPVPLPKARSSSPTPISDETNNRPKPNIPQIRLSTNNARYSIEDEVDSPSPLPTNSDESSALSENEIDDRPISVRSVKINIHH
jgi:hypothetical protein